MNINVRVADKIVVKQLLEVAITAVITKTNVINLFAVASRHDHIDSQAHGLF